MASTHDYEIDSRNDNIQIYIDGQFFPRLDTKVSVMDSGYLLGDGVWEGIRLYNNHLIHLEKHLERLYKGCLLYTSPSPRDVEESRMPSSA